MLSVVLDYLSILPMLLTSPLVTFLVLTSSIAIIILTDFIILYLSGHNKPCKSSGLSVFAFGDFCILVSVVLINLIINTEIELIEDVVEETFEGAVRFDETLSPVLSAFLELSEPSSGLRSHNFGIESMSPKFNLSWRKNAQRLSPLLNEVGGYMRSTCSGIGEYIPLKSANHLLNLYSLDSGLEGQALVPAEQSSLFVYGGVNHKFIVKSAHTSNTKSPNILP